MKEATKSYKSINTILEYFGVTHEDYWHLDYKLISDYSDFNYYWDVSQKYTEFTGLKDELGIPLYLGSDGNYYYSSIFLGHYALGAYQYYLKMKCPRAYEHFIQIADWFVINGEKNGECPVVWINRYPMDTFDLSGSWQSCLSQAKGISVLCRAYYLTKDEKYITAALEASEAYFFDKADGGVRVHHGNDFFWEEYPTKSDSIVLNGHVFSVWSLNDLLYILKEINEPDYELIYNKIYDEFNVSLDILKRKHILWDVNYWTRYDLWEKHYNIASLFYHKLHIKQFQVLYNITDDFCFNEIAKKWNRQLKNPLFRLYSLFRKVLFRL